MILYFISIYKCNKRTTMKNNADIRVRLPKKAKEEFKKLCEEEFIDMSVKIRQIILKELKENKKD